MAMWTEIYERVIRIYFVDIAEKNDFFEQLGSSLQPQCEEKLADLNGDVRKYLT